MKTIIKYSILLLFFAGFVGCQEQSLGKYEDDTCLSFYWGNIPGKTPQKDSISCSFFILSDDVERDTVWLRLETMGLPSNEDRQVKFVQLQEEGAVATALPGVHYIPFDSPELQSLMVVKKNQVKADVPIVLLKDETLKTNEYRLLVSIAPNDYFVNGIDRYQTFLIKITNKADQPESWKTTWKYFFGDFGPVKLKFLIQYVGIDFTANYPSYLIEYYKRLARERLEEYNNDPKNEILKEDDGTPISFDK